MDELYELKLRTGDSVIFRTDMTREEVEVLPVFPNQYEFHKYFQSKDCKLEIHSIIKKGPL